VSTREAMLAARSIWWLFVIFGVVTFAVGVFLVIEPHETLSTLTAIAGIFLLVDGVFAICGSIFGNVENRGLLALVGVLGAIAGVVLIKEPFATLVVFALIIGIWFIVVGVIRFVSAFAVREGRGLNVFLALLDLAAGIVIVSWPELGLATLAVIIGIVLIIRGILFTVAGFELRRLMGGGGPGTPAMA
jgi:uncharacterized membrane protein HdeD (DUF308 family)